MTRGRFGMAIDYQILDGQQPGVVQVGVEGQQQRGAFQHNPHAGVTMPVNASLVALGLLEPALQVEVVLRQVGVIAADKEARLKAGHHLAHVSADRIVTRQELVSKSLKPHLTFLATAPFRIERLFDCTDVPHIVSHLLEGLFDLTNSAIDTVGQPLEP